jgi:opacity protein-like surface antigen
MKISFFSKVSSTFIIFLSTSAFAESPTSFFIEGLAATPIHNLSESSDYAGASGYFCSNCPTGKLGGVHTSSDTTWALKAGYTYSENLRMDMSYYSLSYGKTSWGTDFRSFNGTYNPASATPFTSNKLSSDAAFISAYYNLNLGNGLKPYAGLGIGLSRNNFGYTNEGGYNFINSHTNTDFAWKLDVGSQYEFNNNFAVDLSITLINVGEFKSANNRGTNHEAIAPYKFSADLNPIGSIGVIYKF